MREITKPRVALRLLAVCSIGLVLGSYFVLFQTKAVASGVLANCGNRFDLDNLPCLLNLNSGILSADAIFIALFGVLIAVWAGTTDAYYRQADDARRKSRFEDLLYETTYEAAHNLQHIATLSNKKANLLDRDLGRTISVPQVFDRWPEFRTARAQQLLDEAWDDLIESHQLWGYIDHMSRNAAFLGRYPFDDFSGLARAEEILAYFTEYCVRVLIEAARFSPRGKEVVKAVVEEAGGTGLAILTTLVSDRKIKFFVRFQAGWARSAIENVTRDTVGATVALCWFNELELKPSKREIAVHPLAAGFAKLGDPPSGRHEGAVVSADRV